MNASIGKVKMYGIVRDKDGNIKVDNWDSLSPELKSIILKEMRDGGNTRNDIQKRAG